MKRPSLTRQIQLKLEKQLKINNSRYKAKVENQTHYTKGIYSYSTFKTYMKHSNMFANWLKENYKIKYIDDGKPYIREYIKYRENKGLSAWTVKLDLNAIAKLYDIRPKDLNIDTKSRLRANIIRSRGNMEHDKHLSISKNKNIIDFCKGTGLRRHELLNLKKNDLIIENNNLYLIINKGKGGKNRTVKVLDEYKNIVLYKFNVTTDESYIFNRSELKNRLDIHSYRREYASTFYKSLERDLSTLETKDKYYCRKDLKGVVYDKNAMLEVSKNLGHNRIDVIATNYLN